MDFFKDMSSEQKNAWAAIVAVIIGAIFISAGVHTSVVFFETLFIILGVCLLVLGVFTIVALVDRQRFKLFK